jgi:hypothetical protein
MAGPEIARRVWSNAVRNTLLFGALALGGVLLGGTPAKILFWVLVVLYGLDVLHVLLTVLLPTVVLLGAVLAGMHKADWSDERYMLLGVLIQLSELAIGVALILWLRSSVAA